MDLSAIDLSSGSANLMSAHCGTETNSAPLALSAPTLEANIKGTSFLCDISIKQLAFTFIFQLPSLSFIHSRLALSIRFTNPIFEARL
jgi:hypothetical protein